jgi:uncharacterized membrane protein
MVVATSEAARATTQLTMEIEGSPELEIRGVNGLLSGSAVAGREQTFALEVVNSGSADLTDISFSSYKPSQWQVEFTPDKLDTLAAGETREIQAVVQPSSQAITGDYNVTFRANASEDSASERFRITVKTASMWSVVSLLIIAAAAVVLVFAIKKFGRR